MFNNTFASKRWIRPRICYRRLMQSCESDLSIILPIHLRAFSILIGSPKKTAWQVMLMVQINQKNSDKLHLLIVVLQLLISYLVISEDDTS